MTAFWAQLLHLYQPPTQTHDVLHRIADESYRPLVQLLREHPHSRIAININGVLTDTLREHGMRDIVDGLRALGERGQIEFVGSGKHHPILPLIPAEARRRSIAENSETNRRLLGEAATPGGFFPPEMCYSADIARDIVESGHRWAVLSGIAAAPGHWPTNAIARVNTAAGPLAVFFRDDTRSNRISFRETNAEGFLDELGALGGDEVRYVLTAMDGETFGHHIKGWDQEFLGAAYARITAAGERTGVVMVKPSELFEHFPEGDVVEPRPSSWSTSEEDIAEENPYPLWNSPGNAVHALQWEYVEHCLAVLRAAKKAEGDVAARYAEMAESLLQPALHSCQFWWASRRPMWDVPMIHRGFQLLNSVLVMAMKAVNGGTVDDDAAGEARWRFAAANEIRDRLERELFFEPGG